jgi:uncharacterized protein YkwD/uncharacterized membrane protein required for colicin V production
VTLPWPDLLVAGLVALSAWRATRRGFVAVLISLAGFVVALLLAFTFYQPVAQWLTGQFGWTPVWSAPVAFVAIWGITELAFGLVENWLMNRYGGRLYESTANKMLAIIPGAAQGFISAAVMLTLFALVPLQSNLREDILDAPVSGTLVRTTLAVQRPFEGIFGPAAREALGFITIAPPGIPGAGPGNGIQPPGESVDLRFRVHDATPAPDEEQAMLDLVNQERTSRGLVALTMDEPLREVARAHAGDMFARGYFAHNTPEGVDPFERMRDAGIFFGIAGENLALAPTLDMAHNGLMNSPGHRANILRPEFRKVGIGVLDGGIYGKMWVQEFSD